MEQPNWTAGLLAFAQRGRTSSGVVALQQDPDFLEYLNELASASTIPEPVSPTAKFLATCQDLFEPLEPASGTGSSSEVAFSPGLFTQDLSRASSLGGLALSSSSGAAQSATNFDEPGLESGTSLGSATGSAERLPIQLAPLAPRPAGPGKQHKKATKAERQRRAVSEMEQQIQTKLAELDLLTQENRQLQMRFSILELACDRQQLAIDLLAQYKSGDLSSPSPLFPSMPGSPVCTASDLQWAMQLTVQSYKAWWLTQLQQMSILLVDLDAARPDETAMRLLHQLVSLATARICLAWLFSPLVVLKLKRMNMDTEMESENLEAHWQVVVGQLRMTKQQACDVEALYESYEKLHGSLTDQLMEIQKDLAQHLQALGDTSLTEQQRIESGHKQLGMLKGTRTVLQKMHVLFSATIAYTALNVLQPVEFARCCIQSYPYFPCGASLLEAGDALCKAGKGKLPEGSRE